MADHMNGYINGARTELELKTTIAASINRRTTKGMSHHFLSCRRKSRNSLKSCNMIRVLLPAYRALDKASIVIT